MVPNLAAAYKERDSRDKEKMQDDDADDRSLQETKTMIPIVTDLAGKAYKEALTRIS